MKSWLVLTVSWLKEPENSWSVVVLNNSLAQESENSSKRHIAQERKIVMLVVVLDLNDSWAWSEKSS